MNELDLEEIPKGYINTVVSDSETIVQSNFVPYTHEERVAMKLQLEESRRIAESCEGLETPAETADRELRTGITRICPKCLWAFRGDTCDHARAWWRNDPAGKA